MKSLQESCSIKNPNFYERRKVDRRKDSWRRYSPSMMQFMVLLLYLVVLLAGQEILQVMDTYLVK